MPTVHFTSALNRFNPKLNTVEVEARSVKDVMAEVEKLFPGLRDYIVDESGSLRKHVNIFHNHVLITDPKTLSDKVGPGDNIHIIQALSGG